MARTYRALLVPTAAIDAAGNAKPNLTFSVTPLGGGSPVAVYAAASGGNALAGSEIKSDSLGNIGGLYVADPGPYVLTFTGGGTAVTTAVVDPRDTASPGDVDAAVAGVIGGAGGAGSGISLNPDGSIQDNIGRVTPYDPASGTSYPVFDAGAASNPPAYPDVFTWDATEQWFVIHQDGLYLVNGTAAASAYSENAGSQFGWRADGGANPSYLGDAFATDDTAFLRQKGASAFSKIVPMPAGSKVWLGITRLPGCNVTLSYVSLTITQLAIL